METARAVERLTEHHTELTEAGHVAWPPLLLWLDKAVTEQVKRGGAGSNGAGLPFDMGALSLLGDIEKGLANVREALYLPKRRDLIPTVKDTWAAAQRLRANRSVDDEQWAWVCSLFPEWVSLIEAEWGERARRMEVTVACPRCNVRWVSEYETGEVVRRSAIVIEYSEGKAPVAECRNADCLALWVGWADVAKLGLTVNSEMNLEVLAACGINLQQVLAQ